VRRKQTLRIARERIKKEEREREKRKEE